MSDVLVKFCVGYSCCCVEKLSLVRKGVLFRVAGEVSDDLSRGTRLLLFGRWCGVGEIWGSLFGFYWGFSKASKFCWGICCIHHLNGCF